MSITQFEVGGVQYFTVTEPSDVIEAADSSSFVYSYAKSFTLPANIGSMQLLGGAVEGTGNPLDNWIVGNSTSSILYGLGGNDYLFGRWGADSLFGGEGDDHLDGGEGADFMAGGAGNDGYGVDNASDQVVEAPDEGHDLVYAFLSTYTLPANVEALELVGTARDGIGNALDNTIWAHAADNFLDGAGGNDAIFAGDGNDKVLGGDGDDLLHGQNGDDYLSGGAGNDTLHGDEGNDTLVGGPGVDYLGGGKGDDTYFDSDDQSEIVEFAGEGFDTLIASNHVQSLALNVEHLVLAESYRGSAFANDQDNVIDGNAASNTLFGLGGNDTIFGGGGNDRLFGGDGNDALYAGSGNDELFGGDGIDLAIIEGTRSDWKISFTGGNVHLDARRGGDHVLLQDIEHVQFTDGSMFQLDHGVLWTL